MTSERRTAIIVGILFIVATAAPIMSFPFLQPLNARDLLVEASARGTWLTVGALLELIMALAITGIATTIYPVLRRHSEALALGYVGARILESVVFIVVAVVSLLSLVTLSQRFMDGGSPDASAFYTLGRFLRSAHDWAYVLGGNVIFTVSALILNTVLYQSRLVPRFISVWGLLGAALLLVGGLLAMFGWPAGTSGLEPVMFLPIALQEVVFAVWLIAKGFDLSIINANSKRA